MLKPNRTVLVLLCLHILLAINSGADVLSKYASYTRFASPAFIGLYLGILALLFIYAIGWQQVIKRMPLTSAFANKAVTIIWGIFWGALLFGEEITWGKALGAAIIMAGIVMFALSDRHERKLAEKADDDE